ncbi:MAG: SGNH/GDSL hydrolase family protein [Bacteroidetes bacterium]|nr:SGNH/GDSL hydrolase family protein [Bacteroidota bacterium]
MKKPDKFNPMQNNIENKLNYLALGDSYTIGESVPDSGRFPVQLVNALQKNGVLFNTPEIIATTGWTTDELAAAIKKKESQLLTKYNLVSLLIGVNNQYRGRDAEEYRAQFKDLLKTAIVFAGGDKSRVFVVSIPDWGVTPFAEGRDRKKIGEEIDLYNKINKEETQKEGIAYVDITPESRNAATDKTLVASDGLHPSEKMYKEWVDMILPHVKKMF